MAREVATGVATAVVTVVVARAVELGAAVVWVEAVRELATRAEEEVTQEELAVVKAAEEALAAAREEGETEGERAVMVVAEKLAVAVSIPQGVLEAMEGWAVMELHTALLGREMAAVAGSVVVAAELEKDTWYASTSGQTSDLYLLVRKLPS